MATLINKIVTTPGLIPTTGQLANGEIAIDPHNASLFLKRNRGGGNEAIAKLDVFGLARLFDNIFTGDNTGTTDVTAELQAALQAGPVFLPKGTYKVQNVNPASSCILFAFPRTAKIIYPIEQQAFNTTAQQTYQTTSQLQLDVTAIAKESMVDGFSSTIDSDLCSALTVSSTAGIIVGDILQICSNDFEPWGNSRYGEAFSVLKVTGTKIYVAGLLEYHDYYTTTIKVTKYKTDREFIIDGVDFEAEGDWRKDAGVITGSGGYALNLWLYSRARIINCRFSKLWTGAATFRNCPYFQFINNEVYLLSNYKTGVPDTTLPNNPLATISGQKFIYVNHPAHGLSTGSHFELTRSSVISVGGIPANEIFDVGFDIEVLTADSYRFPTTTTASSNVGTVVSGVVTGGAGGTNTHQSWGTGRLGYGVLAYGGCVAGVVRGVSFHQCRHAYTTGGFESTETYNPTSRWYLYSLPTNNIIDSCDSFFAWGPPWDTHEQGSNITFTNVRTFTPSRGPDGGSYQGYGIHNRSRNTKIINYHQYGGTNGIRLNEVNHLSTQTVIKGVYIEGCIREGSNNGEAIIIENHDALTNDPKYLIQDVTVTDSDVGIRISAGNIVTLTDITLENILTYGIHVTGTATITAKDKISINGLSSMIDGMFVVSGANATLDIDDIDIFGGANGLDVESTAANIRINRLRLRSQTANGILSGSSLSIQDGAIRAEASTMQDGVAMLTGTTLTVDKLRVFDVANSSVQLAANCNFRFNEYRAETNKVVGSTYGIFSDGTCSIIGDSVSVKGFLVGVRLGATNTYRANRTVTTACTSAGVKLTADCVWYSPLIGDMNTNETMETDTGCNVTIPDAFCNNGKAFIDVQSNTLLRIGELFIDFKANTAGVNTDIFYCRDNASFGACDVAVQKLHIIKGNNVGYPQHVFREQSVLSASNKKIWVGEITEEDPFNVGGTLLFSPAATKMEWNNTFKKFISSNNIITYTTSATISMQDLGRDVVMNSATAVTLTLPKRMPIGTEITIYQQNTGLLTFAVESGGTLVNAQGHTKASGQHAIVKAIVVASTALNNATWAISGNTAA